MTQPLSPTTPVSAQPPLDAQSTLDREFLGLRAKILEIAATFDRIQRAEGAVHGDPRVAQVAQALEALTGSEAVRAATVQQIFSLPFDEDWRSKFEI